MRVTTLFKRLLGLDGVRVVAVELEGEPGRERVVVDLVRPPRRWLRCPRCAFRTRVSYDRSPRTLRHLDVLWTACFVRLEVRRLACPRCGVVAEELPFARAGSRFTRAFEDTCVWLVRDAPKTVVSRLLRVDWATVGRMLERVVAEQECTGGERLGGLRRIGIDEVSYRKGRWASGSTPPAQACSSPSSRSPQPSASTARGSSTPSPSASRTRGSRR